MGYILYSLTLSALILVTGKLPCTPRNNNLTSANLPALYLTRNRWSHLVPLPEYIYTRLPSSFTNDIESGFTSTDFDLSANVAAGDSRTGLDQQAKREVQKIMKSRKVDFDEARRLYTQARFAKNDIGPDGLPRDPKFVSFS